MIPLRLKLTGFLSYRETAEVDFTGFELACISGSNGAGKSSLLDAMTWVLFGQARKRDDSLINTQSKTAEVVFDFLYEGNEYRIQRSKTRDKTALLEFFICLEEENGKKSWRPLTEKSLRETETRIEQTLRLDYETFTNASFFLQGQADQFAQQRPGDRKRILSSILGLDAWEQYRERAANQRKELENDLSELDGRMNEINAELLEGPDRIAKLASLEQNLAQVSAARQHQAVDLENLRKLVASINEQKHLVDALEQQLNTAVQSRERLDDLLASRQEECRQYQGSLARAEEIEAGYQKWQADRKALEQWDQTAAQFHQYGQRRSEPLMVIEAERVRLTHEIQGLQSQQKAAEQSAAEAFRLEEQLRAFHAAEAHLTDLIAQRAEKEAAMRQLQQSRADANAENPRLFAEMNKIKERINQLKALEGATCPFCGQPLGPTERAALIESLTIEGTAMGDRYRQNKDLLREFELSVQKADQEITALSASENGLRQQVRQADQILARLEQVRQVIKNWETQGVPRLDEVSRVLAGEAFCLEARASLAEIDADLRRIGYDTETHDRVRRAEQDGRAFETSYQMLQTARAALAPLEREIAGLQSQMTEQAQSVDHQQAAFEQALSGYQSAAEHMPDLDRAEQELMDLQERENRMRMDVGAARQKVDVLERLRVRQRELTDEREERTHKIGRLKTLERAFGKDGVPALLIEQALPEIETQANQVLDRLSSGTMSVRFATQKDYKDKNREDKRETLDILISDGSGTRDYEMFSGGEAFRVNFAIRLALSRVLAQRAGARLQTLVIDEGFGSQDAQGRQRLVEAINLVREDFSKILVITHMEELKEAFPNRIEVEKTPNGSTVKVA